MIHSYEGFFNYCFLEQISSKSFRFLRASLEILSYTAYAE